LVLCFKNTDPLFSLDMCVQMINLCPVHIQKGQLNDVHCIILDQITWRTSNNFLFFLGLSLLILHTNTSLKSFQLWQDKVTRQRRPIPRGDFKWHWFVFKSSLEGLKQSAEKFDRWVLRQLFPSAFSHCPLYSQKVVNCPSASLNGSKITPTPLDMPVVPEISSHACFHLLVFPY
jgi:hypothetical protein